jgi:ABC-type transport system substrate-binding protein
MKLFKVLGVIGVATAVAGVFALQQHASSADKAAKPSPGATELPAPIDRTKSRGGQVPAKIDTLVMWYPQDPDTINPLIANDSVSKEILRYVHEPLAALKFSDPDTLEPRLAESWVFDEKTLTFTIKLRKGVKWHPMTLPNGKVLPAKELTARDVKFTYDCALNPNIQAASMRSYFEDPDATDASQKYKIKVTLVDDYTVKIKWTKPYFLSEEISLLADWFVIPRHVYSVNEKGEPISFDFSSKEFADGFNSHWANRQMCGTGPLMFKKWDKEERMVLERNPDYWGPPSYYSKVIFRSIPNSNTSRQLVLQNEIDWVRIPEKNLYLDGKEHENVKSGKVAAYEFDFPGFRYVGYNQKRDLFKDKRVRWALAHAIPVDRIIDVVFKGLAVRMTGPLTYGSSAYDSSIPPVPFDLEQSAKLLSEAGWEDTDGNGVRSKTINGKKVQATFDLMIYSDNPSFLTIAEIIKENCRKVGVDVQISPAKWGLMLQKLRKKEFDAAMLGWVMDWRQDLFQLWHSSQADLPESSNAISYVNKDLDKLIEEHRSCLDKARQVELYHQMHRILAEDQPYTFLFSEKFTCFGDARVQNVKFYKIRPCYDTREWFSSKPRELAN